jgi:prepilin-type N-terminal cleavage/methylation domain-containing protein
MYRLCYRLPRHRGSLLSRGFTLIELLVVIAIVGVLLALIGTGGNLTERDQRVLRATLTRTFEALEKGNPHAAYGNLVALVAQLSAFEGNLSQEQREILNQVREVLWQALNPVRPGPGSSP